MSSSNHPTQSKPHARRHPRRTYPLWLRVGALAGVVAVLTLSGHLLLEWYGVGRHAPEPVPGGVAIKGPDGLEACPLCRLLALGAVKTTPAFIPVAGVHCAAMDLPSSPGHTGVVTTCHQPRAPPS